MAESLLQQLSLSLAREGFTVARSKTLTGASGQRWAVDLYFEKIYSLGRIRGAVLVAGKGVNFRGLVRRASLMKSDLLLDKVIIVVEDEFGEDDLGLARMGGVELLALDKALEAAGERVEAVAGEEVFHLEPAVPEGDLGRIAERHRGFIFRRGEFRGYKLVYLPLACFDVIARVDLEPEHLEAERTALCFELLSGSLTRLEDSTLRVAVGWTGLGEIDRDSLDALSRLASTGRATRSEVVEWVGGEDKADAIIEVLEAKGLVEALGDLVVLAAPPLRPGYRALVEGRGLLREGPPERGEALPKLVEVGLLREIIGHYCIERGSKIVYYPVYLLVYTRRRGGKLVEIAVLVDGVSGERMGDLEELFSRGKPVLYLDKMIDEVISGARGHE